MSLQWKVLLSIIIPCYNQEKFIKHTFDSLLKQSFNNWECIVVDDGSTDSSKEIIQAYKLKDYRIKYAYKENGGLSSARNFGINLSIGKYLHFLDGDDTVHSDMYVKLIQILESRIDIDIAYGRYDYIDENGKSSSVDTFFPSVNVNHLKYLAIKNLFPVHAAICRKNIIEQLVGFDEALASLEDWDFWLRAALKNKNFYGIRDIVCSYRQHANGLSANGYKMNLYSEKVLLKNADMINQRADFRKGGSKVALNSLYLSSYARAIRKNDFKSTEYLKPKVSLISKYEMIHLMFNIYTLPAVLNYINVSESIILKTLIFPMSLLRMIVRKLNV